MKRYLIFAAVGPFFGGLLLLFATTVASGYWTETNLSEVGKFFSTFAWTLQYSYLFGIVPSLMIGAIDDILLHVPRIHYAVRMLILGVIGFRATDLLYASRGPDSGALKFRFYGRVGLVPALRASGLAPPIVAEPQPVHSTK